MVSRKQVGTTGFSWPKATMLIVIGVGLYGLVPKLTGFSDSLHSLKSSRPLWVLAAVTVSMLSYIAAALVYICLAKRPLKLGTATLVQLAGNFANRLVPAGIGAIATNYRYLRRTKHTQPQAEVIVMLNNVLGFVGNMLLLAGFIIFAGVKPRSLHIAGSWVALGVLAVIVVLAVLLVLFGNRVMHQVRNFWRALSAYRRQPQRLVAGLLASIGLTLCYSLCLLACVRAVGLSLSLPAIFISMSLGVAGATVTPTPGGLGGAEAALVAALIVYGAERPQALAAVLLYRLCTFWLPLIFGGFALVYARKRQYI